MRHGQLEKTEEHQFGGANGLDSNLLSPAFTGYLLAEGEKGSAPGESGVGRWRDFLSCM